MKIIYISFALLFFSKLILTEERITPKLISDPIIINNLNSLKKGYGKLLPNAKLVGEWNKVSKEFNFHKFGPRSRDYCLKMIWSPERKRALFCGANHGVPHRLNDVWEFDLPSNTWVMLYAPDLNSGYMDLGKDISQIEFRDGILYTKRGGPAVIAHTFWGIAYDNDRKEFLFMNTWVTKRKREVLRLNGDPTKLYDGPPLWTFSPEKKTWRMIKTNEPRPKSKPYCALGSLLEYIPDKKGFIWHAYMTDRKTWFIDSATRTWKDLKANVNKIDSPKNAQIGYYDQSRKIIIAQRDKNTFHFDLASNKWSKVIELDAKSKASPLGHNARSVVYYDVKSKLGFLYVFKTSQLWSYNPDKRLWKKISVQGDQPPKSISKPMAYLDYERNVFVVINGIKIWVYRL